MKMEFVLGAVALSLIGTTSVANETPHCPERCRLETAGNLHSLMTGAIASLPADHGQCTDEALPVG